MSLGIWFGTRGRRFKPYLPGPMFNYPVALVNGDCKSLHRAPVRSLLETGVDEPR
jgi:hypothetical protein